MKNTTKPRAVNNPTVDLDAIADAVLARIVERIAGAAKPAYYSTRRGHDVPGMSHAASQAAIEACPHSVRRGRYRVVDRESFESWEKSQLPQAAPQLGESSSSPKPEPWSPERAFASIGLRKVGG